LGIGLWENRTLRGEGLIRAGTYLLTGIIVLKVQQNNEDNIEVVRIDIAEKTLRDE